MATCIAGSGGMHWMWDVGSAGYGLVTVFGWSWDIAWKEAVGLAGETRPDAVVWSSCSTGVACETGPGIDNRFSWSKGDLAGIALVLSMALWGKYIAGKLLARGLKHGGGGGEIKLGLMKLSELEAQLNGVFGPSREENKLCMSSMSVVASHIIVL